MYKKIRRAAYHLADGAAWTADFRALRFPEHWQQGLLELHNHGRPEEARHKVIPTRRLDGVLQTLAPDVLIRPRPRPSIGGELLPAEDFWMYVPAEVLDPLPGSSLEKLLDAWLRTLGPKGAAERDPGFRSQLLRCSAKLKQHLPVWETISGVGLLDTPVTAGGTAAPEPRQFQLATDTLARRILTLAPFPFEGGELRFRALPRGPRDQGAELMSQPVCRTIKRKDWWFSIVLNVSLQTTPLDPRPRLHLHWGVRRWATHPKAESRRLHLPYRESTTVYLQPRIPWLPGAPATERYALARLRRDRASDRFAWVENDPAGILRRLSIAGVFPDPDRLLSEPAAWLGEGQAVQAAVVHSTRMGVHEVGPGLMPHQRSQLTEWAEQALPDGLTRVPDLVRGRGRGIGAPANRRPKPRGDADKKAEESRAAVQRRTTLAALSRVTGPDAGQDGPVVEARLLWQTAELRRQAIVAFAQAFGLDGDGGAGARGLTDRTFDEARPGEPAVLEWRTPELTLRVRCLPLINGLGDRLVPDESIEGKGARIAAAIAVRRRELCTWLRQDDCDPSRPGLAMVEIAHRSTFRPPETDPKFAVRLGCADAGLLTQFVVTPSDDWQINNVESLDHRVHNAWLDGLRQLGVRVLPQHTLGGDLPEGLEYAALWMVKRRKDGPTRLSKHLPIAVLVSPLPGSEGLAVVRGWDDDACDWIPYPSFLLHLVQKAEIDSDAYAEPDRLIPEQLDEGGVEASRVTAQERRSNLARQRRETASFLQRMLFSLRGRPTVLITHAQNSRSHWPWLQDGQIVRDLLRTGHAGAGRLDDELRLVRIRGRAGRETAQWWGLAEPGKAHGQPAGFWALPVTDDERCSGQGRIFYSTTERPGTHAISPALDRLATRVNAAGHLTSQAGTGAWNPTLVEIAVLGCHKESGTLEHVRHKPDEPEAIALAMHQLRQAPDYPAPLALPLPLHLASLAQAYVLPMLAEGEAAEEDEHD
ncbi:pPIWI_RE module domain-containing protein [Streptomyces sp. NPDC059708]|uniref:pPIWI_RE module domain-containing protein n=1 Tax=Streptomyces sp. NPDC059708 TaxID=3346916 RepID=UPI0036D1F301